MEFTYLSLLGAFIMLVIGVLDYAMLQKFLYAPMRDRYERAKVTGSHGMDPASFWNAMRAVSFLIMPLIGFVFGNSVLSGFIN